MTKVIIRNTHRKQLGEYLDWENMTEECRGEIVATILAMLSDIDTPGFMESVTVAYARLQGLWVWWAEVLYAPTAAAFAVDGDTATIDGTVSGTTLTVD